MSDFLVMRIRSDSTDNVEWVTVDAHGALIGEPGHGELADAAEAVADNRVIVLAPAPSVLRTSALVPVRGAAKVLQALPFAMEEQLATDVDKLHFAAGKRDGDGLLRVAAVERAEIEAWLESLAEAGIQPSALYAESDAVSAIPNTTTLLIERDSVLLREADGAIAVTDPDGVEAVLELWLNARQSDDEDEEVSTSPTNLLIYQTEETREEASIEALIVGLEPRVTSLDVRVLSDGALARLAAQIVAEPGINLLQGAYAPASNLKGYLAAWRSAAILFACLTAALLGAKLLEIAALKQQAASLDSAIEQAIRYTFPEVREIRDARALLQSKLGGLRGQSAVGAPTEFLDTLKAVAGAVSTGSSTKLETINYRSGVMELRVLAPNVEALDTIQKQIVKNGGLQAEIQSANPEGDGVRGRIQIKGGA